MSAGKRLNTSGIVKLSMNAIHEWSDLKSEFGNIDIISLFHGITCQVPLFVLSSFSSIVCTLGSLGLLHFTLNLNNVLCIVKLVWFFEN